MRRTNRRSHDRRLSRRQYAQILAGASVASIAGCIGDDDEVPVDDDDDDVVDDDDTVPADDDDDDDDDPTDDDDDVWDPGEPQRDSLRVHVNNFPEQSNFNPWAATPEMHGTEWLTEIATGYYLPERAELFDGHTWEASEFHPNPDIDEISIPTIYTDFEVEAPFDRFEYIRGYNGEEPLTYTDGTEINADAIMEHERLYYHTDLGPWDDSNTFNFEKIDDYAIQTWRNKGEAPDQDANPAAQHILETERIYSAYFPWHPDYTVPWNEQFEDATSEEAAEDIIEELSGDRISFSRWAENEWGGGLYALDPDRISSESAYLVKRDDHPNEHATIPEIQLRFAEADRRSVLANQGELDAGGGIVQDGTGRWNRETLPDHFQEIQRYLQEGTDVLQMNWNNEHLANLWVRRAIVAAVDWFDVGANGWGPERSFPVSHHVYLGEMVAEATFSEDFLEQTYTYPLESDLEQAEEWMERGGYTKDGDTWVDENGEEVVITMESLLDIEDWIGAHETIQVNLQQLGLTIDMEGLEWSAWEARLYGDSTTKTMGIQWGPAGDPWESYQSIGAWWAAPLVGGDPENEDYFEVGREGYGSADNWGRPFEQQIPVEVGEIDGPDAPDTRQPDLEAAGIESEEISLPELVHRIEDPEATQEEVQDAYRKCARYANYYVPNFLFHNYTWGLVGNVRDFNWPPEGHSANLMYKGFSGQDYQAQGGVTQVSYDDDYPDP